MEVKPKQPTILEPLVGTELPFPDLFDRSERTIGATFAKFGDLKYFTPV
jgi:dynein heavy chain